MGKSGNKKHTHRERERDRQKERKGRAKKAVQNEGEEKSAHLFECDAEMVLSHKKVAFSYFHICLVE